MQNKKRILAVLFAAALMLNMSPGGFAQLDKNESASASSQIDTKAKPLEGKLELYTENKHLGLYYNSKTTEIAVKNNDTGVMWYSNPQNRNTDTIAKGINLMLLNSQLNVRYTDNSNQVFVANNFVGSINRNGVKTEKIENGIKIIYDFPRKNENFSIPVQYKLKDDRFEAEILLNEIKENGESKITEILFLPCFGAGGMDNEGYLFIPDGSGAIINYNNGKQFLSQYSEEVYGRDPILTKTFDNLIGEDIRLPVYGMKTGNAACLGIISSGAALASISTQISGNTDSYNRIWSSFSYRLRDSAVLAEKDSSAKEVTLFSDGHANIDTYRVSFCFLSEEQASYSGMAATYRKYLEEIYNLQKKTDGKYPFFATFYGGVKKKESVFGIPLSLYKELTSYDAVKKCVDILLEKEIAAPVVAYKGWSAGGMDSKVPDKVRFERNLGGKKDFLSLKNSLDEKGIPFYPSADFINLYKSGHGTFSIFDAVKTVSRAPALQYRYKLSTQTKDQNVKPWYLLKMEKTQSLTESYLKSAQKYGLNLLSDTLGRTVYTQVDRKSMTDREQVALHHQKLLEGIKPDLLLETPNAYALGAAKQVIGLPSSDSRYDTVDYGVPFYQMVLHGYLDYSLEPSNTEGRGRDYFLKVLEYGAGLQYNFTQNGTDQIKDTEYNYLYATEFSDYIDKAASEYTELKSVLEPLQDKKMIDHRRVSEKVSEITYENGTSILVNYGNENALVDGQTISAKGYLVVKGAQ